MGKLVFECIGALFVIEIAFLFGYWKGLGKLDSYLEDEEEEQDH